MDNSIHSFTKKSNSSKGRRNSDIDDAPEESGWTDYIEDFISDREYSSNSFSGVSSSMVSDAASCAAWNKKFSSNDQHNVNVRLEKGCKNLSFSKKRRSRIVVHDYDDSLEDTASSPVNSPKVSDLRHMDMNYPRKKFYENIEISQEKRRNCVDLKTRNDERNEIFMTSTGMENECTELKKRGLCLVPMSMLVNYLG